MIVHSSKNIVNCLILLQITVRPHCTVYAIVPEKCCLMSKTSEFPIDVLMFWKYNIIFGMPKLFGGGLEGKVQ